MSGGGGGGDDPKDPQQTRQLAFIAAEKWNMAQKKLRPLQDQYLEDARDINSDAHRSYARGRVNAGMQEGLAGSMRGVVNGGAQVGLDAGSGKSVNAMTDAAISAAGAGADTSARTEFEIDNQEQIGLQNYLGMGTGQEARAMAGFSDLGRIAGQDARAKTEMAFNRRSANLQTLGTVAGAGLKYGMGSDPSSFDPYQGISNGPNSYGFDPQQDAAGLDFSGWQA